MDSLHHSRNASRALAPLLSANGSFISTRIGRDNYNHLDIACIVGIVSSAVNNLPASIKWALRVSPGLFRGDILLQLVTSSTSVCFPVVGGRRNPR